VTPPQLLVTVFFATTASWLLFLKYLFLLLRFADTHYAVANADAMCIAALPTLVDCCFLNF